jgi:gluconolactonase
MTMRAGIAVLLMLLLVRSAPAQQVEVAATVAFTEGPTVDRDGNVYFSEMISQRIMKLDAAGALTAFRERSNRANGLVIDTEGRLVACESGDMKRVTRTDLRTGVVEVLADGYDGKPFASPNDVTIDGSGRIYFSDFNGRAVYRIDSPGRIARILIAPDVEGPNGLQVSPDDKTLYVAESNPAEGGARLIRAYDLLPDGTVANMRVHYNFYLGRGADGMSIDVNGNLYASAGRNDARGAMAELRKKLPAENRAGVYVISPQGTLLNVIPVPEDAITNNAFGGADMKTLYVTAGRTVYRIRVDVAGLPR